MPAARSCRAASCFFFRSSWHSRWLSSTVWLFAVDVGGGLEVCTSTKGSPQLSSSHPESPHPVEVPDLAAVSFIVNKGTSSAQNKTPFPSILQCMNKRHKTIHFVPFFYKRSSIFHDTTHTDPHRLPHTQRYCESGFCLKAYNRISHNQIAHHCYTMAAQWIPIHSWRTQCLQEPRQHLEAHLANIVPIPISESRESGQHKGCQITKVDWTEILKVLKLLSQ